MEDNEKIVEQVAEAPEQQESAPQQEVVQEARMSQADNLRALREKAERAERERDELAQRMRDYEARMNPVKTEEEDLSFNIGDDDLPEGKHIKKMQKSNEREFARQKKELEELKKQTTNLFVETRLKAELPDLDKVVSQANLKMLSEKYPELAATLSSSTDYYAQAKSAYTMIKNLGIGTEDKYLAEKELAKRNASKPVPMSAIASQKGERPLDMANMFANGMTAEAKQQMRELVERNIRNG